MLLEDALEDINVKVDVNYDLGTAEVEFDESKTSLEKIKETIKAEGDYQVE